jgi:hypothetical protein
MRRLQKAPAYPLIPFAPLVLAGSVLALEILTFARVVSLTRAVEALRSQRNPLSA